MNIDNKFVLFIPYIQGMKCTKSTEYIILTFIRKLFSLRWLYLLSLY